MKTIEVIQYVLIAIAPSIVITILAFVSRGRGKQRSSHMQNYHRTRVWNNTQLTEEAIREKFCR